MRYIVLPFLFCLSLWVTAQPLLSHEVAPVLSLESNSTVAPGELVTIQVVGAPAKTVHASFDLSPRIRGLSLRQTGPGVWQGSFAVMPSMAGEKFRPQAHLYDVGRQAISVKNVKGLCVSVASSSSSSDLHGALVRTPDGRVAVAFDEKVRLDTLEVRSRTEVAPFRPDIRNNYVVLPKSLKPENIVSVSALNLQGVPVVVAGPAPARLVVGAR